MSDRSASVIDRGTRALYDSGGLVNIFAKVAHFVDTFKSDIASLLRLLTGQQVAILGAKYAGKTTLGEYLENPHKLIRTTKSHTNDAEQVRRQVVIQGVAGAKPTKLEIPLDLPGQDGVTFPQWNPAIRDANQIWYIFRADLISQRDKETVELVDEHLKHIQNRINEDRTKPKVLLIGTHAEELAESEIEAIGDCAPLALMSPALKAKIVAGSLATNGDARRLVRKISKALK